MQGVHQHLSGWAESEIHVLGRSVYNSIGTFSALFLSLSQVGYMECLNLEQSWACTRCGNLWGALGAPRFLEWVGGRWGGAAAQNQTWCTGCLFCRQHKSKESVQWNGKIGKFGKWLLKVLNQKYPPEPGVSLPRISLRFSLLWMSNRVIKCDGKIICLLFFFWRGSLVFWFFVFLIIFL